MNVKRYLEDVYAGFLGMNIGIRLGAPVELGIWTYDRIRRFYGEIKGYVKDFKNFAADDDLNGPVYFLRALDDGALDRDLTPEDVANAWLNYAREGIGMFWWGGYGVSTEHTAYLNLKKGIKAPKSGSIEVNGKTIAEQIGGQIFIDTWGFIFPGMPEKAAKYATIAASVSHDGNGLYGAAFIASCIAEAFVEKDVEKIIEKGLSFIPADSTYCKVVRAVMDFYKKHPESWRDCMQYLFEQWGYDRYPGACHIIPNAGVCIMSLLYGQSFARSVEIATMASWDTDCNAGNVGSIMGVRDGLAGIPDHYRSPINDELVLSGISGALNILDVPTYSKKLASIGLHLMNKEIPDFMKIEEGEISFDFDLPGSTHGFRTNNEILLRITHSTNGGKEGSGALAVLFDSVQRCQGAYVYYKPFYRRDDFDDERYSPVFSPLVYPGQKVKMSVRVEMLSGESVTLAPYVRATDTKKRILLGGDTYKDDKWHDIEFEIPRDLKDLSGTQIDEVGIYFEGDPVEKNKDLGVFYIDNFSISGKPEYSIDLNKSQKEFSSIIPFSHNHGAWNIENGRMSAMCLDECEAFTGRYFAKDVTVESTVSVEYGSSALLSARVQGAMRGYYGGLCEDGIAIYKNNCGMQQLAFKHFEWKKGNAYKVMLEIVGTNIHLEVDGEKLFASDSELSYGMVGYKMASGGRASFGNLIVREM